MVRAWAVGTCFVADTSMRPAPIGAPSVRYSSRVCSASPPRLSTKVGCGSWSGEIWLASPQLSLVSDDPISPRSVTWDVAWASSLVTLVMAVPLVTPSESWPTPGM